MFPQVIDNWERNTTPQKLPRLFTKEELLTAQEQIKIGKAPGADKITPEAIKLAVQTHCGLILDVMNKLLSVQTFPKQWKKSTIALIEKKAAQGSPVTYRPICMLSVAGKLLERLVKIRLEEEVNQNGGFSEKQFGFRKGRSAIQAVNTVVQTVRTSSKKWFLMVAVDVKNAFNTVAWSRIIEALQSRGISPYLINLVESYFKDREIIIDKKKSIEMTAGVPQGSILGPTLWNLLYDQVLQLRLPNGVSSIAYADDLAIMVEADEKSELEQRTNESLLRIGRWMQRNGLQIAPHKTEAIIFRGPRRRHDVNIVIDSERILPKKHLVYLGITLDERLTFGEHVKRVVKKAETKMGMLTRILPNVGGPGSIKRVLLCRVIESIILYGAPVWRSVVSKKSYTTLHSGIHRKALIRVGSGYRTVSTAAIEVVVGIPPITLQVEERCKIYAKASKENMDEFKEKVKAETLRAWQTQWDSTTETAQWTKCLIKDIKSWVKCQHRRLDFFVTQFLTGHGNFGSYLAKMNIQPTNKCSYCGSVDTPEHTILMCSRWQDWRTELEENLGQSVSKNNIIEIMTAQETNWDQISAYIKRVLKTKKEDESSVN